MLHKTSMMRGYHIHASDGVIGHVDDFLIDEKSWATMYMVVDTSNWLGGRTVLIATAVIQSIDSPNREIRVTLSREDIERGPSVDSVEIELVETLPSVWIL
jgi:hypothetical protein